jgi:hypothetical protein
MAEFRQQYLDVLQGYGVDPASLRGATDAQLKRILKQAQQAPDIGGEMASGTAGASQAAKEVIGGTTPVKPLEELLAEAHTSPPITAQPDRRIRAIRTNNAGDLRAPDEATGRRWWGKHGFVGLDDDGFAIFKTPEGGVAALEQQVRIDQGRNQTQAEFIGKFVGAEDDPEGYANALRNIPQFTGASPDTALADIDRDVLVRAITRSEGGKDSLKHFGLNRGNFLALDRAQGQAGQRQEADSLIGKSSADTDLPMSYETPEALPRGLRIQGDITGQQPEGDPDRPSMKPIPGWKPTGELVAEQHTMPGARTAAAGAANLPMSEAAVQPLPVDARIAEKKEAARLAQRPKAEIAPGHTITLEDAPENLLKTVGKSQRGQPLDIGIEVEDPFGARAELGGDATAAEREFVARNTLMQDVKNQRQAGTPMTEFRPNPWSSEPVDPSVADMEGELTGAEKEQYLLGTGGTQQEIQEAVRTGQMPSGERTIQSQQKQQKAATMRPSMMQAEGIRGDRTAGIGGLPEGAVEQPDMPTMPEAQRPGLLGRLGGMIKDNPEVAAQIAQAAGGLMSNIASGRAERKAGKETEGRVARANLISALTGGKARPQVTAAQADEGGLLSRLGQITTAGGKIATGEMERRRAEDVEERGIGLKERQVDTMDRRLDIMQDKINKDFQADLAAANAELSKATGASYERVQGGIEHLNKATNLYKSGGYLDPTSGAKGLYGRMQTVWEAYEENPSAAGVGAIFQIYQRFFDPATVREGDLKIMEEAQGPLNRLKAAYERIQSEGGTLSSDVVEEMKNLADKTHQYDIEKAKDSVNAYIENAIAPQDRQATLNYYDRLFTVAPVPGTGGATELTEALQSGEIILD